MPVALTNYANTGRFKPSSKQLVLVSNSRVLRDVLPADATNYVLAKIERYNNSLDNPAKNYTITDDLVSRGVGTYNFNIRSDSSSSSIPVAVRVINYGGLLSITVTINGKVQDIS
jgi:hypothetical protein